MAGLASIFDEKSPLEHDIFGYGKDALIEHWAHLMRQPVMEFSTAVRVPDSLDAEADLGKGHHTDKKLLQWLASDERQDP